MRSEKLFEQLISDFLSPAYCVAHPSDLTDSELSDFPIPTEVSSLARGLKSSGRQKTGKSELEYKIGIWYNVQ